MHNKHQFMLLFKDLYATAYLQLILYSKLDVQRSSTTYKGNVI